MKRAWRKYYLNMQIQLQIRRVLTTIFHKQVIFMPKAIKKRMLELDDAQEAIRRMILEGKPAMVSRFGSNEALCTGIGIGIRLGQKKNFNQKNLVSMHRNAGVFPYGKEMALRFSEISEEAAKSVDLLGWWSTYMQDYLALEICNENVMLTRLGNLEPYYSDNPWTDSLKGKKVLVIHPFKESIEAQYKKRELLFDNPNMLPEFELTVLKAIQTIAGEEDDRFADWEEALNYMFDEAMKIDFDVAILGCGAYGMPLAAKIKQAGKIAIHLGGATQLLFGIKGRRWDEGLGKELYNQHWIRPSTEEVPNGFKKVEGGCYW